MPEKSVVPRVAAPKRVAPIVPVVDMAVLRDYEGDGPILDHVQLREAIVMAKLAHKTPGLQVWTGFPGVGKTMAAEQLAFECDAAVDAGVKDAFRTFYFLTGGDVNQSSQRRMKRGIYCVYEAMIEELSEGELRRRTEKSLAEEIVEEARLDRIQLIIVDEAGTKSVAELRGFGFICDVARRLKWPLSILLVGMDDLAAKSVALEVVESRTRNMSCFSAWDACECGQYVVSRSPRLAALAQQHAQTFGSVIEEIMKVTAGRMREVQTLLPELDLRLGKGREPVGLVAEVIARRADTKDTSLKHAERYRSRRRTHQVPL